MLKFGLFILLIAFLISFRPGSRAGKAKRLSRQQVFIIIAVFILLTGAIFYFVKMLKIAVLLWLALIVAVAVRVYLF